MSSNGSHVFFDSSVLLLIDKFLITDLTDIVKEYIISDIQESGELLITRMRTLDCQISHTMKRHFNIYSVQKWKHPELLVQITPYYTLLIKFECKKSCKGYYLSFLYKWPHSMELCKIAVLIDQKAIYYGSTPLFYENIDDLLDSIGFFDRILTKNLYYTKRNYGQSLGFESKKCKIVLASCVPHINFIPIYESLNDHKEGTALRLYNCEDENLIKN